MFSLGLLGSLELVVGVAGASLDALFFGRVVDAADVRPLSVQELVVHCVLRPRNPLLLQGLPQVENLVRLGLSAHLCVAHDYNSDL